MAVSPHDNGRDVDVRSSLQEFRCIGCGYGASRRIAPERCPMCSGTVWDFIAVTVPDEQSFELDATAPLSRDRDVDAAR